MKQLTIIGIVFFTSLTLFAQKKSSKIIYEQTGYIVFFENPFVYVDSKGDSIDVVTDSLPPDLFIPATSAEIKNNRPQTFLEKKRNKLSYPFLLFSDCNDKQRNFLIQKFCDTILLNNKLNKNCYTSTIYIMPVTLEYIKENYGIAIFTKKHNTLAIGIRRSKIEIKIVRNAYLQVLNYSTMTD